MAVRSRSAGPRHRTDDSTRQIAGLAVLRSWLGQLGAALDRTSRVIGVGRLLFAAAAADLVAVLLTDYSPMEDGRGTGLFWWLLLIVWPLRRTYRGGDLARRVARTVFGFGVCTLLLVALPGFTAGDGQAWYWYPYNFLAQCFGLLVVCSPVVRAWCVPEMSSAVEPEPPAVVEPR